MDEATRDQLTRALPLLCCPACGGNLAVGEGDLSCASCAASFPVENNLPLLFQPTDSEPQREATAEVRAFYEETPFPDYDEFDSASSLMDKARKGLFAQLLDDGIPPGSRVLECGCGTAQLSNFLSISNRHVFGTDMSVASLRLGQDFKERNGLSRTQLLQMNLFRPVFRPDTFDVVISNGVLHHTPDPFGAFRSIAALVKPGGYVLVGLYHRYGRLITDLRRALFRVFGGRLHGLDPNLRSSGMTAAKANAWLRDQYQHPLESKHTMGEVLGWFDATGFDFVKSIPRGRPFQPIRADERLFEAEPRGTALERGMVELGMIASGSREGGFFVMIGRRQNSV